MSSGLKRTNNRITAGLSAWFQLTKILLCLPVALSSCFGFILYKKIIEPDFLLLLPAMLMLACGAASVNSIQEMNIDSFYQRTKNRPLVTGKLSITDATVCSFLLFSGSLLFFSLLTISLTPIILGTVGVILYNAIYTPLKSRTSFALIFGGVAGALPPVIGWTTAGGLVEDVRIIMVAALFFLWQIPHFFMILLQNSDDYKRLNSSSLAATVSQETIHRLIIYWVFCYLIVSFSVSLIPGFLAPISKLSFLATATIPWIIIFRHLIFKTTTNYPFLFKLINGLFFSNMLFVSIVELIVK